MKQKIFNILYRLGDNGSLAVCSFDLDEAKERHLILANQEWLDNTQYILLVGLNNYGEYQPVTTVTFENALAILRERGSIR